MLYYVEDKNGYIMLIEARSHRQAERYTSAIRGTAQGPYAVRHATKGDYDRYTNMDGEIHTLVHAAQKP